MHASPGLRAATSARSRPALAVLLTALLLVGIAIASSLVKAQAPAAPATTVRWGEVEPQPFSNSEAQSEVVGGRLYSFGGFDATKGCCTPTDRAFRYDPATNAWTALAPMPDQNGTTHGGVTHAGMTTDGTNIFWAGGYTADSAGTGQIFGTREVWRYNVAANTYTRLADLPQVRAAGQLEFVAGKLHFFGGTNAARSADTAEHWELDLGTAGATWQAKDPLPNARHHLGAAVLDGKIYAIGGQHGHDGALTPDASVHAYDPGADDWTERAALPAPRNHITSTTVVEGGRILVLGGQSTHGTAHADVFSYDPVANAWGTVTSLPAARHSAVAGVISGRIYLSTGGTAQTLRGIPDPVGLCEPNSDLACADVKANLPLDLGWSASEGGYADRDGQGTGFTMVQPSTTGAYLPELLDVDTAGSRMVIRTTKGIQYKVPTTTNGVTSSNNNLDNGLGIGVDASKKLRFETTLINPPKNGNTAMQGGLWFGPDQDNYVKLVVVSAESDATPHKVQMVREVAGASAATDEVNTLTDRDYAAQTVRLILVADPGTGKVTGSYRVGTSTVETALGELTVPASFFDGSKVAANARAAGSTGFAGIFATHRNTVTTTGLDFAFGEFTAAEVAPPVQAGNAEVTPARLVTNDDVASTAGAPAQTVTIRNTGDGTLTGVTASLSGSGASQWTVTKQPDASVPEGGSTTAEVTFRATTAGPKGASLDIASSDPDAATVSVNLRGLGATGLGGSNEPSLQWILDTYEIPVSVGDDNAGTNVIHSNTTTQKAKLLGNEITAQTFRKAPGTGSVTVEPLAVFGPDAANPVVRFGSYAAGDPAARDELFTVGNSPVRNAQTVNVPGGIRSFDPGSSEFGLYSIWPFFDNRQLNTEDALNTFTGAIPHHVRTYPLKTAAGAVEPNAYVVATEEHVSGFDYQDVVAIVRNVEPVAVSSNAEISVENLDEVPFADRLSFSRIQTPVSIDQGMHDTVRLRVRNTGTDPLTLRSAPISGPWELVAPPSFPATVAPGGLLELTVKFTAQTIGSAGGYHQGSLTLQSNDTDESTLPVELAGFWQSVSEGGQEPDVDEVARVFGYKTNFGNGDFNNRGRLVKLGEEVHSAYWKRADATKDVVVRQLAALHGHPGTATFSTTNQKVGTTNPATQSRLTHYSQDAQSLLPRKGDTNRTPGKVSITPAQMTQSVFGFKVDGEWSDWTINNKSADDCSDPAIPCGHHMRFWPARDRAGALIPHTYLMVMDYSGINYDFNDNMYLISNVRPTVESEDPSIPKPCTPLACDQIKVATPYALDFGAARAGTILDKDDQGTGFTHVDKPSNATGYLKANLDLDTTAGQLAVTTTAGLNFAANNSMDNGLAVGLPFPDQTEPTALAIRTRLVNLPAGTQNNQQGGLWFGRDQDNYVKLVVISGGTGTRIQLLRETGGLSDGAVDQVTTTGDALALTGQAVSLELLADPATRRVTGTYTLPGQNAKVLGSFVVDPSFFSQDATKVDERIGTSSFAGILASHRQGPAPLVFRFDGFSVEPSAPRPSVTASRPADGATGVLRDESVSTDLSLPNAGGIDNSSLTADTVRLVRVSDGMAVPANRGTSGGGDVVNLDPSALLDANTQYRFEITDGLKDASGQPFLPYTATFTTGSTTTDTGSGTSTARFERVALPNATAPYEFYSGLTMGPDGKLYAGMIDGRIRRFAVAADGTLGTPETITTLVPSFNAEQDSTKRALVGIRFEPGSTASNPVLWVSHATFGFSDMPDWGGVITRLSGPDLDQRRDVITGLPRSTRDHLTNGIDFGPDGALYFNQGSINAMGRGDNSWAQTINGVKVLREERALSAATLRLDTSKVTGTLNVKTEEGGSYDPFAPGAPLTVFASGIRNAYDLVWHSNGQLYVPTNGSAAGGNTPGTPSPLPASCSPRADGTYTGPSVPALSSVGTTQHDYLFRAVQGGYYGHPNPKRCEWVLNGGNPTSAVDRAEVTQYPVGTQPDRNWRGAAYDFGLNKSPNGVVEYRSDRFGGTLKGKLLVVRYSNSNDVIALTPGGASQDIVAEQTGIPGLSSTTQPLKDPLDITEDTRTGNLYVSEYDQTGQGQRILLLRAQDSGTTPTDCAPNSTLPCTQVKATAPKTMEFDRDEGGLKDAGGQGTGFTMVQPSSNGGAFLPGRLDADPAGSKLTITTTKGIQFKTATTTTNGNSLDNGLGVGFDATKPTTIETTLVNPPLGTGSSEQAGVWFGPDEDNYAKLVVASAKNGTANKHKVQLLREVAGASVVTTNPATTDELNSTTPANEDFTGQTVHLTLVTDPAARTVTGSYRVGTGAAQTLGTLTVPASFFDGSTVAANARTAGSTGFAGIFATHRNNPTLTGLDYVFGRFALTQANQAPSVTSPGDQSGAEGDNVSLPVQASDPEGGALSFAATGLPAGLSISPTTGVISGTIAAGAATGSPYQVTVTATDAATPALSDEATFAYTVTPPAPVKPLTDVKVNFQNEAAPVPTGYLRDFGEGYGPRTGAAQGTGYAYGWVAPGTSTPRSLTTPPNGRDRNLNADQRLDTLMHMQGNDVPNFTGTPLPASWEIAAPDGRYRVTVAVGDPAVNQDPEFHTINVEGVSAVSRFAPTGAAGTATHHQVATLEDVTVTDGRLTLDAIGGTNTKINYVDIAAIANTAPVVTKPADRTDREGDAVSLQVQATDAESANLVYSASNLPAGLSIDGDEGLISGTVAAGAADGSPYTVTVKATDTALPALSDEQTFTWTVTEADGPTVESTTPAAGASEVAGDTTVKAVFSEPVVNVNATTFTLRQGATAVPADVQLSVDGLTATLDPTDALEPGKAYTATVKGGPEGVRDAAGNALAADETWTFTTLTACDPYAAGPCSAVKVDLPYERSFGAGQGGLADKDGDRTGLTMVQPSGQNTASDPIGSGYVPGALDLDASSGRLSIDAGLGIQFKNQATSTGAVNQLKNALGVGVDMPRKLRLETTLVNPPLVAGTGAEQAGLWFGPDQDHYVKLVVGHQGSTSAGTRSHRINFLREKGAVVPSGTGGEINVPATGKGPDYSGKSVKLVLELDSRSGGRVEAFFEVDGTRTRVGAFENLGAEFFDGSKLTNPGLAAAGIDATAGIFATKRNTTSTAPVVFTFDDVALSSVNNAPVVTMADREDEAGSKVELPVAASDADRDTLTYSASGLPAGLAIDPVTGVISGTAPAARTEPYAVTVTATDDGDGAKAGTATFAWTIGPRPTPDALSALKVNFETAATATPEGYVKDSGQGYGSRGTAGRYGWVRVNSNTAVDLSLNARERTGAASPDLRFRTLMHMQGDDLATFAGTRVEGAWELAVPDGMYTVTVAVGDPLGGADPQRDSINVEGVSAIDKFDAAGIPNYTPERHKTASVTVPVTDGRLTLDAIGGTNTKIDFVEVEAEVNGAPVVTAPADTTVRQGEAVDLSASATDPDGDDVAFSAAGLPAGLSIHPDTGAITGTPTAPGISTVTVTATDDGIPAKSGEDSFELTVVEGTAPTVTEVSPAPDATGVAVDATVRATFSEPIEAGVGSFTLGRGTEAVAATVTLSDDRRVATLTPSAPLAHAAAYTATVAGARDDAGNPQAAPRTWSFKTLNRAPQITAPGDQSAREGTAFTLDVAAQDPDAGQAVSLTAANLPEGLTMSAAGRISGTIAAGQAGTRTVTLTARDDFDPSASATETFSFTVVEGTAPTVTSVAPADGATGVAPGADVVATFSEPVKAGVELGLAKGTTAVTGTVTLNAARTQATFDPAQPLEYLTEYTATVSAAQDDAGNALASAKVWSFRTADRPEGVLSATPASVTFASTETGAQRTQEVVLANTAGAGARSVTVSSVTIAGTDAAHFSDDESGTLTLAPGESETVVVTFAPTTTGTKTASLVAARDGGPSVSVALSGTATAPAVASLTATPAALAFGDVEVDASEKATVTVRNTGTATATVGSVALTGTDAARFSVPTGGFTLAPAATKDLEVTFAPTATGARTAELVVDYGTAAGSPLRVALSGTGTPKPVAGPAVRINAGGPAQTVDGTAWSGCSSLSACGGRVSGGFAVTKSPIPAITGAVSPANAATYVDEWTGGQTNGVPAGGTAFTFDVPVASGQYDVRLHFAENHQNGVGKRLFDVRIEGATKLSNFDIFAETGGMHRATVRQFRTSVTDGKATIQFIRRVENAAIMGIEIVPVPVDPEPDPDTTAPAPVADLAAKAGNARVDLTWTNPSADFEATRVLRSTQGFAAGPEAVTGQTVVYEGAGEVHASTGLVNGTRYFFTAYARDAAGNWSEAATVQSVPEAPAQAPIRINMGGPALTVGGVAWRGCATASTCTGIQVFGGFPYKRSPLPTITGAVAPASAAVYQDEWTGGQTNGIPAGARAFGFDIPVINGRYLVRLHFAENNQTAIGRRLFDVQIEGGPLELSRFDIFAQAGGMRKAIVREFTVNVTGGELDLDFIRRVENAKVDGVEVIAQPAGTVTTATASALTLTTADSTSGAVTVSGQLSASGATLRAVTGTRRTAKVARRIVLEGRRTGSKQWRTVGVAVAGRTGKFKARVSRRGGATVLRARYSGDRHVRPAVSRGIRIRPGA